MIWTFLWCACVHAIFHTICLQKVIRTHPYALQYNKAKFQVARMNRSGDMNGTNSKDRRKDRIRLRPHQIRRLHSSRPSRSVRLHTCRSTALIQIQVAPPGACTSVARCPLTDCTLKEQNSLIFDAFSRASSNSGPHEGGINLSILFVWWGHIRRSRTCL